MRTVTVAGGGTRITLRTYGRSHQGLRRPNNEDAYLIRPLAESGLLVAVADGVGGGPAGQEASRLALETLDGAIDGKMADIARLASAVSLVNRRIYESSQQDDALAGMGTTLTSAIILPHRLLVAHVGDSRAYQLGDDQLVRLTVDHSLAGEMEALGELSPEEAQNHPNRHVLTRVVGPFDHVRIDVTEMPWTSRDRLLLCTDGLTAVLSDDDILESSRRLHGWALVDALIALALERGGPDNITVVLAESAPEQGDSHGR
ncbi:MAG: protein phosphatase 2C domain-containing protein [Firmicutes bacterium]|nr:protein phosphatase 2C domain-containing protein [Bacillota bacterium]